MKQDKFVIIQGSSKSKGNTNLVVNYILSKKQGHFIDLKASNITYYDYNHKNIDDDFLKVIDKIMACDVVIFATPVYWYTMSAVMKTFFDRLSDLVTIRKDLGRRLKDKKVFVIACSSDDIEHQSFWEPFRLTAEYLDMNYSGHAHTWIKSGKIPQEVEHTLDQLISQLN